ncbi:LOW QUALITY PROTEIN: zinc finger CCCH domain-containing protein 11A [Pseudochaenichthys georgianus]|uniref:LOW QUALITY PROTEIN: zinc finger CCCH domain-containing protein 11A n=1 Tax=Pseudochaenichthys georgianus TaxID=52239 RepID=UPI00146B223C|nr:LOW QUALITY PROTEIN: zinc finger CCCH domain-containing protein 11A [Pseudochaenichthys georgianus]
MTNHGDDCYFFYYSTCTKGDSCPFRHCEAAMGSEIVCNLWQEGRCFRTVCKFRHMEITKNRKEIPCYWESQSAGCQKPHCAFFHDRPRYIEGMFVPPDKSLNKAEEQPHEEPAPPPLAPLPTAANPQLRGVIKTETQEPVPSPTHPPVVINPADDDEDEDDQYSEEGEDGRVGLSPRKLSKSDSLNFGVSTLEEIRLRKALKASMKRTGYPIQRADTSSNGEKENIQSFFRPALFETGEGPLLFQESGRARGSVAERLGKKMPNSDMNNGDGVPLRRGLAGRLGRIVDEEEPPQKALKPIKDRLGLPGSVSPTKPAETNVEPRKASEQIRIKTLEEIRQEKAGKSPSQSRKAHPETDIPKPTKSAKRAITVKKDPISHIKTFSEILHAKKKRQEDQDQSPTLKKARLSGEKAAGRSQGPSDTVAASPEAANLGELGVKTLEEIRMEKAGRSPAPQCLEAENKKSSDSEETDAKKPRLASRGIKKPARQTGNGTAEQSDQVTQKTAAPEASDATSNNLKVKTFEEIMREKRLRKQEMEEQAKGLAEAEPSQKQTAEGASKRTVPAKVTVTYQGSSPPDSTPSTQKLPVSKPIPLNSKAASPLSSSPPRIRPAAVTTASSSPAKKSSSPLQAETKCDSQSPGSSREVPDKNTRSPTSLPLARQARAAPQGATSDITLNNYQKSPEHTANTKVRPKLNVKPSVMKPAVQLKPGQKRRGAQRSAVAAVKPLNSGPAVQEGPRQETACRDRQESPQSNAEAQLSAAVPRSPSTLLDLGSGCSPLTEELQTVPVFTQSQETPQAVRDACTVPQSPVLKSPTQPKSRRLSAARTTSTSSTAVSTSAVDDFEELINEFTDDHLEGDMDPGIEEDDLLQELSEMIDS